MVKFSGIEADDGSSSKKIGIFLTKSLGSRGLGIALLSGSTSFSGSCNFSYFSFLGQFGKYLNSKVSASIKMFQHNFLAIYHSVFRQYYFFKEYFLAVFGNVHK